MTLLLAVNLTGIMNFAYNELKSPVPDTLLYSCFTVLVIEINLEKRLKNVDVLLICFVY